MLRTSFKDIFWEDPSKVLIYNSLFKLDDNCKSISQSLIF